MVTLPWKSGVDSAPQYLCWRIVETFVLVFDLYCLPTVLLVLLASAFAAPRWDQEGTKMGTKMGTSHRAVTWSAKALNWN